MAPQILQRTGPSGLLDVVTAAIRIVVAAPVGQRGFLAVEEHELERERVLPVLERTSELDQHSGARTRVVGADEPEMPVQLRVVVATDHDPLLVSRQAPLR